MRQKTLILANGQFPESDRTRDALRSAERIVCCDGAAEALLAFGMMPDVVIGDLDSLADALRSRLTCPVVRVEEQETNDLCKAFRYCTANGWNDLLILGATGKREDHTLGNISHLAEFTRKSPGIRMLTETGQFFAMLESGSFECTENQAVSIFALDWDTPIQSEGLQYPLNGLKPRYWWEATLNRAVASRVSLSFPPGHEILVFVGNQQ